MGSRQKLFFVLLSCLLAGGYLSAQKSELAAEIKKIYQGFPLDSSYDFIADYCRANQFQVRRSPVDPSRSDYSKRGMQNAYFPHAPDSINQSSILYEDIGGVNRNKSIARTTLELQYLNDSKEQGASTQFRELTDKLKKWSAGTTEAPIHSDSGELIGHLMTLWLDKPNSYPLLSIAWKHDKELPDKALVEIIYVRSR